jgi:hypothetical protein
VKTSGGKVIRDDESEAETQAHWLPVFDYDGESTADQTDGEYDNDGFDPYDDDESAVNDRGQVEAANNEPDMRAGLSDSAPMVDIHAGGSLPRRQSDGVVVDSQNAEDEEEEEPATDVRFVPEFEFQSDEDDDDAVQATFGEENPFTESRRSVLCSSQRRDRIRVEWMWSWLRLGTLHRFLRTPMRPPLALPVAVHCLVWMGRLLHQGSLNTLMKY